MNLSSAEKPLNPEPARFLQIILNASTDGIVITNAAHNIVLANRHFCALLGQTPQEITSANLIASLGRLNQDVARGWAELSEAVWRNRPATGAVFKLNTSQGVRYFEVNASLVEDSSPSAESEFLVSAWRDITVQEQTQAQLRAEFAAHQQTRDRLVKINQLFLTIGPDPAENIQHFTALLGEMLGATCVIYNRLENGVLCSVGQWQTPPDYVVQDHPQGHICYDIITGKTTRWY